MRAHLLLLPLLLPLAAACGGDEPAAACFGPGCASGPSICQDNYCSPNYGTQPLEVPTAPQTGQVVKVGEFSSGLMLYSSDFAFQARAGRVYEFSCTAQDFERCELALDGEEYGVAPSRLVLQEGRTSRLVIGYSTDQLVRISVKALPNGTFGRFQYALSERVDDHPNDAAAVLPVAVGAAALTGQLDFGPDVDVFTFEATQGHLYAIRCEGAFSPDVTFELKGPDGQPLPGAQRGPAGFEQLALATATGLHTLRLAAWGTPAPVPYRCSLEDRGADDHGDTRSAATPLVQGTVVRIDGTLPLLPDEDFFSFEARAGHAYRLHCTPEVESLCGYSRIEDAKGSWLRAPAGVAGDSRLYVHVHSAYDWVGTYAFTLEDLGPDHGTGAQDAVPLPVDAALTGYLTSGGDEDFFQFQAEAQRIYRIHANGAQVEVARMAMPGVSLTPYASQVPGGLFKLTRDEPALLRLSGASPSTYSLRVEALGMDDHPDLREEAASLGSALLVEGRLDTATDVDWFALELEQRPYASQATAVDTKLLLLEADGLTRVPWDAAAGVHVPRAAGRHYVRADVFGFFRTPDAYRFELFPR